MIIMMKIAIVMTIAMIRKYKNHTNKNPSYFWREHPGFQDFCQSPHDILGQKQPNLKIIRNMLVAELQSCNSQARIAVHLRNWRHLRNSSWFPTGYLVKSQACPVVIGSSRPKARGEDPGHPGQAEKGFTSARVWQPRATARSVSGVFFSIRNQKPCYVCSTIGLEKNVISTCHL